MAQRTKIADRFDLKNEIIFMQWQVEVLNETVACEIEALPKDIRAKYLRITALIQEAGLSEIGAPYVKHLEGKLWEMRLSGRDGIARVLYIAMVGRRVVVLRAFIKKTQKTPRSEMELAFKRAKEIQ